MATTLELGSKHLRMLLLWEIRDAGKLNDETLPHPDLKTLREKPYREWPEAMQQRLEPFLYTKVIRESEESSPPPTAN